MIIRVICVLKNNKNQSHPFIAHCKFFLCLIPRDLP